MHKNRHYNYNNQKPRFFQGNNYSYFGVGNYDSPNMCRMGQNEKGLAMGTTDVFSSHRIDSDKIGYTSDRSSPGEDYDFHHCLGSYSKVKDAALWLARHSRYHGNYFIISSEPGVGAAVFAGIGAVLYSNGNKKEGRVVPQRVNCRGIDSDGNHLGDEEQVIVNVNRNNGITDVLCRYSTNDILCGKKGVREARGICPYKRGKR